MFRVELINMFGVNLFDMFRLINMLTLLTLTNKCFLYFLTHIIILAI